MYCVRLLSFPSVGIYHRSFQWHDTFIWFFSSEIPVIQNISLYTLSNSKLSSHKLTFQLDAHCMSASTLNLSVLFIDRQRLRVPVSPSPFPVTVAHVYYIPSVSALWHWHVFPLFSFPPTVACRPFLSPVSLPSSYCHLGNPLQLTIA